MLKLFGIGKPRNPLGFEAVPVRQRMAPRAKAIAGQPCLRASSMSLAVLVSA